jgi:hypothetical protein
VIAENFVADNDTFSVKVDSVFLIMRLIQHLMKRTFPNGVRKNPSMEFFSWMMMQFPMALFDSLGYTKLILHVI